MRTVHERTGPGIVFPEGDGSRALQEQEVLRLLMSSLPIHASINLTSAKHWEAGGGGSLTRPKHPLMQEAFRD